MSDARASRDFLDEVVFSFDKTQRTFFDEFTGLLDAVLESGRLKKSSPDFLPTFRLDSEHPDSGVAVSFRSASVTKEIAIRNTTGMERKSPERYRAIGLAELKRRFAANSIRIVKLDHIGFNLPWFEAPPHPAIAEVRAAYAKDCLYHAFPGGEPWDFILPGTADEITGAVGIDYGKIRKPKLELVSFGKCSVPIIQFDVCCTCAKELFRKIFPEGLYDDNLGNIWAYVDNPYGLDLCLVLGEDYDGDWSGFFRDCRIMG